MYAYDHRTASVLSRRDGKTHTVDPGPVRALLPKPYQEIGNEVYGDGLLGLWPYDLRIVPEHVGCVGALRNLAKP